MKNKLSVIALVISIIFIVIIRIIVVNPNELSWDVFGYYIYLPATFVYHDPFLNDISWMYDIKGLYGTSDTLWQIADAPNGSVMYFFLYGMSLLYLPFFLIGHIIANLSHFEVDGFSLPYQYSLAFGVIVYTFIGLYYLRKTLLRYFTDGITASVLLIIVFSTNYAHFMTVKNLETANFLFMMISVLLWFTIKWHEVQKQAYLNIISITMALIVLIKPSEVFCILIPLLWGVYNKESLYKKLELLKANRTQLIWAIVIGLIFIVPQIAYWIYKTGYPVFDSYQNPGIGLDIWSPYIFQVLFSFKKGWLIYTPVMVFALAGFYILFKKNRQIFYATFLYFLASFYIIASWTEWWYGASFSIRPLITTYPVLALPLGYFIQFVSSKKTIYKVLFIITILAFTVLNLFQWWQLENYILDPYRTTKAYYFAIFGKTKTTYEDSKLLSVKRSFNGVNEFKNETDYNKSLFQILDFSVDFKENENLIFDSIKQKKVYHLAPGNSFSPGISVKYKDLTKADHLWIRVTTEVFLPQSYFGNPPFLVTTFDRKEGVYEYEAKKIINDSLVKGEWLTISTDYLTPNIRNRNDKFVTYIWNREKQPLYINYIKIEIFEPKPR